MSSSIQHDAAVKKHQTKYSKFKLLHNYNLCYKFMLALFRLSYKLYYNQFL